MFTLMVTITFSVSPIAVVAANSPVFTLKGSIATVWPFDILVYSAAGAHAFAMEQSASRRHLSSNAQLFSGIASTLAFFPFVSFQTLRHFSRMGRSKQLYGTEEKYRHFLGRRLSQSCAIRGDPSRTRARDYIVALMLWPNALVPGPYAKGGLRGLEPP